MDKLNDFEMELISLLAKRFPYSFYDIKRIFYKCEKNINEVLNIIYRSFECNRSLNYSFSKEKEINKMNTKSIEQWIEELIDKKIANRHLASKGFVRTEINEATKNLKTAVNKPTFKPSQFPINELSEGIKMSFGTDMAASWEKDISGFTSFVFKELEDKEKAKEIIGKNKTGNWEQHESIMMKEAINNFIKTQSFVFGRSSASIKAKTFRIMQESFQKV